MNSNPYVFSFLRGSGPAAALGVIPGLALCAAVTAAAMGLQAIETRWLGRAWLEALVLAILLGTALRTLWAPGPRWSAGIRFGAKTLLEVAVVLLGATISARMILQAGVGLLAGIALVVVLAIGASYALGRLFGLSHQLSTLIACGNSICGNSAIAAVAPVIGARGDDVGASIAFTAVLGVAVVLGLPLLAAATHMDPRMFGVFAGMTVYAVPQVLAATAPVGQVAAQVGTFVKLVRVLMLGPVVLSLSLAARRGGAAGRSKSARLPSATQLLPWFILGFLALVALRSAKLVPAALLAPLATASTWLTIVSMAALGLGVDLRAIAKAGPRVTAVVSLSLVVLGLVSWTLIHVLHLGMR
jgi:uncharacterized integral membrane protein (TIGR00698 family)